MNSASTHAPSPPPGSRLLAPAAAIVGFLIGYFSMHRGLYNDGIFFVQWLSDWELLPGEKHVWLYPHLLYLPLAKGFHKFINLFWESRIDESLKLFSAVFLGVSGPFLARLFLTFAKPALAAFGVLIVFFTPSVWYFAGATEIHTLHLAAAAFALSAAVKPYKSFPNGWFIFGALCLQATHLTGCLLFPAMILLRERHDSQGGPWRPSRIIKNGILISVFVVLLAGIAYLLHVVFPEHSVLREYFAIHPGDQPALTTIWVELILRSGVVIAFALVCAVLLIKKDAWAAASALITFALYAAFIGGTHVEYQGGYNIPAVMIWTLAIIYYIKNWSKTAAIAAAAMILAAQIGAGWLEVKKPIQTNLYRETTDHYKSAATAGDTVIVYIPTGAVDFDLMQLPNLTRLYLSELNLFNSALLDSRNAAIPSVPYLNDAESQQLIQQMKEAFTHARAAGKRIFVAFEAYESTAATPRLEAFSKWLREHYDIAARHERARLIELRER
ncbi:MAG: hypothetical protein ACKVS6_01000 [Planctomycetota bacterium]